MVRRAPAKARWRARVAERLGYRHVDTGAMYRAVAWQAQHDGLPLDDDDAVSKLAERAQIVQSDGRTVIDGHDVTREIRTPEIDKAAASVARLPTVRDALVRRFRDLGRGRRRSSMEGRDIGTVVFPDADLKIYLDASPEERARRRASDPAHTGGAGQPRAGAERHRWRATSRIRPARSRRSRWPTTPFTSTPPRCRSTPSSIA